MRRLLTVGALLAALLLGGMDRLEPSTAHEAFAASAPPVFTVSSDALNVRTAPSAGAPSVGKLHQGDQVTVTGWVEGQVLVGKNNVWAQVGPGQYVYTTYLSREKPAAPPPMPSGAPRGRWIDVNLTQQVMTAYEGSTPTYWALVSTGMPGWQTPAGIFPIQKRVENETMDSSTLAVTSPDSYRLTNVLYTQYFTKWGHAIHDNYWKWDSPFGVPTSHGCIGLPEQAARFFWDFATTGTPVFIHD